MVLHFDPGIVDFVVGEAKQSSGFALGTVVVETGFEKTEALNIIALGSVEPTIVALEVLNSVVAEVVMK